MKTKHLSAVVGEPLAVAVIQPVGQPRRLGARTATHCLHVKHVALKEGACD
jgi:hypothetical protein